ncbi:NAD(P)-dependent oxidoreductase [Rhodobacteraceae bacterium nBUS_24]|jgi:D-3-phosphoglycerate dehydrogenase / 2-oxoglutarate reductase
MTGRILITPRSLSKGDHPGLAPLTEAGYELVFPSPGTTPTEADLLAAVPGCVGWLAGVEPVSEAVIRAADALRVISRNGTGIDNLPMQAVKAQGIEVKRAVGTNARSVAELALGLALGGLRHVVSTHEGLKGGEWPRRIGREIKDAKVAVIGLGAIGSSFAELALSLGASVRGYDPFAPVGEQTHAHFLRLDADKALNGADIVSLHAPMPEDGKPIMDAAALASLAPGAVVINTGRAGLVDKKAVLDALDSGQVGVYATDVFETEPPEPSPLFRHPRVILTSHIGAFTEEAVERTTRKTVEGILEVFKGDAR